MGAVVLGQQLMVFADNPDQLFRYMATALFVGPMLIPLFFARRRIQPALDGPELARPELDDPALDRPVPENSAPENSGPDGSERAGRAPAAGPL
jgi:hypothetical protein